MPSTFKPVILLLILIGCSLLQPKLYAQQSIVQYLSGTDKDHTVPWDFMCTSGMNSNKWSKIAVPFCWEQQSFGTFNYSSDKLNADEKGFYKVEFDTDPAWKNKRVFLVFEGVMTDAEVKVNAQLAGPVHQGAFTQFRYDITDIVTDKQRNQLEVMVSKKSANESVNRSERQSDFWLFGGIYRPVFLEVVPQTFIKRVAVDAKADGKFGMQVFTKSTTPKQIVEVQLQQLDGRPVGKPFSVKASDSIYLTQNIPGVKNWNPEQPNLYNAIILIKEGTKTIHTIKQRFGFRTVEFRQHDGFYVNDVRIIMKGVCRHSQWPESGRTLGRQVHLMDIGLIKDMNMNAVRMSHYPPDREFLDLCDSLGLFVIDELTGWQKAYDTLPGRKLLKEMVLRDVNHPSIIIWANGNEGGWNRALDHDFDWYDPQHRFVMHPWEKFNGTETKHYPDFNYVANSVLYGDEVYYPTEFMHGLYDGGHGAGLDDFWNEMNKHKHFAGAFLWSLHDEGVVRTDKGGAIDIAGNLAPDGIVGPHREKEASYYTIKEIWSPVHITDQTISPQFTGRLQVENRYLYTSLRQCKYTWRTVSFPLPTSASQQANTVAKGAGVLPTLLPGNRGYMQLNNFSSASLQGADVLYVTIVNASGDTVINRSWALRTGKQNLPGYSPSTKAVEVSENDNLLSISCDGVGYAFDKATGFLTQVNNGKKMLSISGGPALAGAEATLTGMLYNRQGDSVILDVNYKITNGSYKVQWIFKAGKPAQLNYTYSLKGPQDFMGITFNYPETNITGMRWLGQGPYRVWKNRMKGQQYGVWQKDYNNTITGESWLYPEFKGWHADVGWVTIQNNEADFTVYIGNENIFLQMLQPQKPKGAKNDNTSPPFPAGSIGFMHAISAIGTKFQPAEVMGPQSQKNMQLNYAPLIGTLYFDFR
ncbi:MAG: glycoside hydrolase family 2 [Chitinophagaceae bacterium]|nr:glycoside hydrolase family 2 [Chitinophagaceae bacterium]